MVNMSFNGRNLRGEIVYFRLPDGRNAGQDRPALVLHHSGGGTCNLVVFLDGRNDYPESGEMTEWQSSVQYALSNPAEDVGVWRFKEDLEDADG